MSSSQADMNGSNRSRVQACLTLRDEEDKKTRFVYSIKHEIPIVQGIFMLYQGGTKVVVV